MNIKCAQVSLALESSKYHTTVPQYTNTYFHSTEIVPVKSSKKSGHLLVFNWTKLLFKGVLDTRIYSAQYICLFCSKHFSMACSRQ